MVGAARPSSLYVLDIPKDDDVEVLGAGSSCHIIRRGKHAVKRARNYHLNPFLDDEAYVFSVIGPHAHIVKYMGREEINGLTCLVMERVDSDLKKVLSQRRMTDASLMAIAVQLASALSHIHKKGYVHGDLRLKNVGIKGMMVKLLDFGCCRPHGESRRGSTTVFDVSSFTLEYSEDVLGFGKILRRLLDSASATIRECLIPIAAKCCRMDATQRPSMAAILQDLRCTSELFG